MRQVARQEDVDELGGIRDNRVDARQVIPARRAVARLLQQLAFAAALRALFRIKLAGGEFQHHFADRIAELALHQHGAVIEQRDHHHRARMDYVLAPGLLAVRQPDDILLEGEELAAMDRGRGDAHFLQCVVVPGGFSGRRGAALDLVGHGRSGSGRARRRQDRLQAVRCLTRYCQVKPGKANTSIMHAVMA
jgi:hypothetical protein